jgi:type I restriction enzyme S subunit
MSENWWSNAWFEDIPSGWEKSRLKDVSTIITGFTPERSDESNFSVVEGVPWHKPSDLNGDKVEAVQEYISEAGLSRGRIIPSGSTLVCCIGTVGKASYTPYVCATNQQINSVTFGERVDWKFGFYTVLGAEREHVRLAGSSTTLPIINKTQQGYIQIPLPPLPTQRRIAAFLDERTANIDALVAELTEFSETLKLQRKALISECVTRGVPGEHTRETRRGVLTSGANPWSDGSFPLAQFKYVYVSQLGKMLQPKPSENSSLVRYLNTAQVQTDGIIENHDKVMHATKDEVEKYGVNFGDLLILEGGEVGRSCFVGKLEQPTIIQNSLHRVRGEASDLKWLHYCLCHLTETGWIANLSKAATISHFTQEKLQTIRIPWPDMTARKDITTYLDEQCGKIDELLSEIDTQINLLRQYRKSLISEAVTGKIEV